MQPINREPKFTRTLISLEEVQQKIKEAKDKYGVDDSWTNSLEVFRKFLIILDWTKTAIYHELNVTQGGHQEGWRVVHFINQVDTEKWHDSWGHTWFGLGASIM